jgi:hypothetical protein
VKNQCEESIARVVIWVALTGTTKRHHHQNSPPLGPHERICGGADVSEYSVLCIRVDRVERSRPLRSAHFQLLVRCIVHGGRSEEL